MSGQSDQFAFLYQTYWSVVRDEAEKVLKSKADALDVAQRVFQRLWASGEWHGIVNRAVFFRTAGRNEALSLLRRRRTRPEIPLSGAIASVLRSEEPSPEAALLRSERRDLALKLIDYLPSRCRLVCTLVFVDGLTHREVSEKLGITIGAVEKQVARGRRRIREMMEAQGWTLSTFVDGGGGRIGRLYG